MKTLLALMLMTMVPLGSGEGGETFACDMKALSKAERGRYQKVSRALRTAVEETSELRDGYAFRLPARGLMTAAEWVSLERRCCPFFTFTLEQSRDGGPVWLRVTGSEGAKEFMREEFNL
jgi:hypothetical protein